MDEFKNALEEFESAIGSYSANGKYMMKGDPERFAITKLERSEK